MADNNDFTIGGRSFKLSKINAMKQFHVVRRIAPILGDMLPALKDVARVHKNAENMSQDDQFEQMATIISPIMTGLARLSDADANFVLYSLLAAVEMKQDSGNWAKISNGDMLLFDNLDLPTMLQAAGRAFAFNMIGFFAVLPQIS